MKTRFLILLLILSLPLASQQTDSQAQRPNVLFIVSDDLSTLFQGEGAAGVHTPNIDELASRGRSFERAYCQVALCNPSRASLMTGMYPFELGIWTNAPHFRGAFPKIKTLPQYFQEQGYRSVGIGKIYHNWGQSIDGDELSWSEPQVHHWAAHYQDWYVPGLPYELHSDLKKGPAVQCEDVPDEAYLDGRITLAAINKMRELQEAPFFLAVGLWKPHLPYNAPKKYWDLYDRNALPPLRYSEPVDGVPELAYVDSNEARSYTDVNKKGPIPEEKKAELRHGYLASISYMDAQVGKLLSELDRLGLSDRTYVVFISDHGYHAGEHGQFGKWTNFEIGTRAPLIIAGPGIQQAGVPSQSLVELVDLSPTLLELCQIPLPEGKRVLSGVSMKPILEDPAAKIKEAAVSQNTRPLGAESSFKVLGSSIRTDQYRYTTWVRVSDGEVVGEELYDLSSDPNQVDNIVEKKGMQKLAKQLKTVLKDVLKRDEF